MRNYLNSFFVRQGDFGGLSGPVTLSLGLAHPHAVGPNGVGDIFYQLFAQILEEEIDAVP
jgi:hypothetical protein